jgi:hypothetical protein
MDFLEDPRLRQRWNQISHTTEAVTENAAAGIWSFGHIYITPCLSSVATALESCAAPCLGGREERAKRARDRERARAEQSFDFYDDWDNDIGGEDAGGFVGGWCNEDWDRLLAGTGKSRREGTGEVHEQPRSKKRAMSYGTRGTRRKSSGTEDPTIIPSTQPIGFLGKLPFKIGGTLRYKPSAANLQEHPGGSRHHVDGENDPLLGRDDEEYQPEESIPQRRTRSGTTGSGDTSDSYRSRGDLFPSDNEGDEDAVPLDDEFAVALDRVDDRSSSRTKSSKGKRIAGYGMSRSDSRTTIDSTTSRPVSVRPARSSMSTAEDVHIRSAQSLDDLQQEEQRIQLEEDDEVNRKRQAAAHLALERGLHRGNVEVESLPETREEMVQVEDIPVSQRTELAETGFDDIPDPTSPRLPGQNTVEAQASASTFAVSEPAGDDFVPARLPYFK